MEQAMLTLCDCCGLTVDLAQTEICPRCQYPVNPEKEQLFLETSIRDLRRVMRYGGVWIRVADLVRRYEARLQFLLGKRAQAIMPSVVAAKPAPASEIIPVDLKAAMPDLEAVGSSAPAVMPLRRVVSPVAPAPVVPAASMRGFTLSSDAVINIVAALGGFFVLAGALGVVLTISSLWASFLIIFLVHAIFGVAGLLTRRSSRMRAVSTLYTIIFALLIPLVSFSAYRLVTNGLIELSVSQLLTLAALYAAVTYCLLAVTQRFVPFAYLGAVALLIVDLALAQSLHLNYWWWPSMGLGLALLLVPTLARATGQTWPFTESLAILRQPLRVVMIIALVVSLFAGGFLLSADVLFSGFTNGSWFGEMRLAFVVLAVLFLCWLAFAIGWTGKVKNSPLLVYQLLLTLLILGHLLRLDLTGYALLLAGVAFFYHLLARVAGSRLAAYGLPGLTLDQPAIGLSAFVLVLLAFNLPLQLSYRAFINASVYPSLLNIVPIFVSDAAQTLKLLALGICLLVTLDISLARAGWSKLPVQVGWSWLLVLSGFILSACYGLEVLLWNIPPLQAFLVFSLAWLLCAILVRRWLSSAWAYPLEFLFLCMLGFTLLLSLGRSQDVTSALLLGFSALLYGVSLTQRRTQPTFLTWLLLLLALPWLWQAHPVVIYALSALLPLLAAGLLRLNWLKQGTPARKGEFVWVLFGSALLYGLVFVIGVAINGTGVLAGWLGLPVPAACEVALLGAFWYATALITSERAWLIPTGLAWLMAVLLPGNSFWLLIVLTPALAIAAALIDRRTHYTWALPLYLTALLSALVVGYTGVMHQQATEASWALLGFALLSYGIGVFTDNMSILWLVPCFASWAVFIAASLLGDLYLPPAIVLVFTAIGVLYKRNAWPFYVTALVAAILTGIYGMDRLFYGALPGVLLFYALIAFAVARYLKQPAGNWLVVGFAVWGLVLAQQLTPLYMLVTGIVLVCLGLLSGQLFRPVISESSTLNRQTWLSLSWKWPWYCAFLVSVWLLWTWPLQVGQVVSGLILPGLVVFTLLAILVTLIEGIPQFLPVPALLAAGTLHLWLQNAAPFTLILAYTCLCILLFVTQFIWRFLPAKTPQWSDSAPHNLLAIGGLCLVILDVCAQGAFSADAGILAQSGVFATLVLSLLLCLYGWLHPANVSRLLALSGNQASSTARLKKARELQHWCYYVAGLVFSLAVSWELLACHQTRFDVLTLVPASYLTIIAPFLLRDQSLESRHTVGQAVALLGAALLLLPAFWFSMNGTDLLPTLILLGEALLLLALGLTVRLRIFVLSSASLIIVSTLRILFLAMPPSLPIFLLAFGGLLVILATGLILSRHRLQAAWSSWE